MKDRSFKRMSAYKKAFDLAMEIFEMTKKFPKEEKYSLTDQIRRSSRSVAVCVAEAYRKRNYRAYFISKTSDADMENSETLVWLDFAERCPYVTTELREMLEEKAIEVGRLLNHMIVFPEKYCKTEMAKGNLQKGNSRRFDD